MCFKSYSLLAFLLLLASNIFANIVINEVHYEAENRTDLIEFIEIYNNSPENISLAGWYFDNAIKYEFPGNAEIASNGFIVVAQNINAFSNWFGFMPDGQWIGKLSNYGETIELYDNNNQLKDLVDYKLEFPWPIAAGGDGPSIELINPNLGNELGSSWRASNFLIDFSLATDPDITGPTPGALNNTLVANAPPNVRKVKHCPMQPMTNTPVTISAKVTDRDGVDQVMLYYQVVQPGDFIPAYLPLSIWQLHNNYNTPRLPNPAFENLANWQAVSMYDNGQNGDLIANDSVFSVNLAGQTENRTLVRYRIVVTDSLTNSVRVPFSDDPSLNFAYYVYNGVPAYKADSLSVNGTGFVHSKETMNSLPVYSLITRGQDFKECWAYDKADRLGEGIYGGSRGSLARRQYNWEGAFFYNGKVYDHVDYRLAGANSRYFFPPRKSGDTGFESDDGYKRSMRIKFKRGNHCQFYDQHGQKYKDKWRFLSVRKGFSFNSYSHYGMNEVMNTRFTPLTGLACQKSHFFHFRVVDGQQEAPSYDNGQYYGDFYGMFMAFERYDSKFLDANDLPDGNLYKHTDYVSSSEQQKRVQGTYAVQDGADYDNIANNMAPSQSKNWIKDQINEEQCYRYWAVCKAVGHNDIWPVNHPGKDKSAKNMVWFFEPSALNPLGELRLFTYDTDLSWGPTTGNPGDESYIAIFDRTNSFDLQLEFRNYLREFLDLVWTREVINPMIDDIYNRIKDFHAADRDRWRRAPSDAGAGDYGDLEEIRNDMKQFAFVGGHISNNLTPDPPGGRRAFIESLAAQANDQELIPYAPDIVYYGPTGYPADQLHFVTSAFYDPQGGDTFAALQWRLGAIDDTNSPNFDINSPRNFEAIPVWTSPELTEFDNFMAIPKLQLDTNLIYRARVRMKDNTGRWSHWSEPHQFKVGKSSLASSIVVSEIMYHPALPIDASPFEDNDFEFIELYNYGNSQINLRGISFLDGISFTLSNDYYLPAQEFALLIKNHAAFASRYDTNHLSIIGSYSNKLSNGGEQIRLADSGSITFNDFSYSDAWYPETDGDGYSLILSDLDYNQQNLSLKSSWQPSTELYGTPGYDPSVPEPKLIIVFITAMLCSIKRIFQQT